MKLRHDSISPWARGVHAASPCNAPGAASALTGWLSAWTLKRRERRAPSAFSLIEIIVVISLLSLITLGLLMMFNQTQRVFRAGLTQVDVLEGGRIVTDMMSRELQQMSASYRGSATNFYVQLPPVAPLQQSLPGVNLAKRTNLLEEMYFLTRENQTWTGIGYRVSNPVNGVGTLFRFEASASAAQSPDNLFAIYNNTALTNMSRVLDGVVHFKVRAFNPDGVWITDEINPPQDNTDVRFSTLTQGEIGFYGFRSNALPAAVEIEIGILEDRTLRRVQSIPVGPVRTKYLEDQAGKVHIFRLRIPVRNVDSAAYS